MSAPRPAALITNRTAPTDSRLAASLLTKTSTPASSFLVVSSSTSISASRAAITTSGNTPRAPRLAPASAKPSSRPTRGKSSASARYRCPPTSRCSGSWACRAITRRSISPATPARSAEIASLTNRRLCDDLVIFGMGSDPEPVKPAFDFSCKRPIMSANAYRPEFVDPLEMERGMPGI